jgi:hypothetical protein
MAEVEEPVPLTPEEQKAAEEKSNMLRTSLYEERIKRLEDENERFCKENKELKLELDQQRADEADIYYYLHKKLDDNYDVIASLEKQILTEITEKDRQKKNFDGTMETVKEANDKKHEEVSARLAEVEETLFTLNEFRDNKEKLEKEQQELQQTLEKEREESKQNIAELERRNVQEKELVKQEMLIKIKETKQNLLSMTEDQLHTTTKRTIMENEQMISELQYQSKETEKLLLQNKTLNRKLQETRRDLELSKETEQELAKRTQFYQKLIKKLHEKLKAKEDTEKERGANEQQETVKLELVTEAKQEVISALQDKTEQLEANLEAVCVELESNRQELQRVAEERNRMLKLQDETVRFLLTSMQDVSNEVSRVENGSRSFASALGNLDDMTAKQRQKVLRHLLNKLYDFQTSLKDRVEQDPDTSLPPIHRGPLALLGAAPESGVGALGGLQALANAPPTKFGLANGNKALVLSKSSGQKPYIASQMSAINSYGDSKQVISASSDGRPWGKRSQNIPLTKKDQTTFLRRGGGGGGGSRGSSRPGSGLGPAKVRGQRPF